MIRHACLMIALGLVAACAATPPLPPVRPQVFLLMGQSNMSGRGDLADAPPELLVPDPRIQVLANDGVLRPAIEPLDISVGQIDQVSADRHAGVGPALTFAKTIIEARPETSILLVPCAKGGSLIAAWAPAQATDTLYGSCLARARIAAQNGRIEGVLWYQGESDAASSDLARAWPAAFESIVSSLRNDLSLPDLPILMVAIGDPPFHGPYAERFPAWREVQAAQEAFSIAGVTVVRAATLSRNEDELHLSVAGTMELGRRLARVWIARTRLD